MAPQGHAYSAGWILSLDSNVHIAQHRDLFLTFTPWTTHVTRFGRSVYELDVHGIGDVHLETKVTVSHDEPTATRVIVLKDVLYVPGVKANIIGNPLFQDHALTCGGPGGYITDQGDQRVGTVDVVGLGLMELVLKSHEEERPHIDHDDVIGIKTTWFDSERRRWEDAKSGVFPLLKVLGIDFTAISFQANYGEGYTDAEGAWLMQEYGGEHKFLRTLELRIHSEDDRTKGRGIARALMRTLGGVDESDRDDDKDWIDQSESGRDESSDEEDEEDKDGDEDGDGEEGEDEDEDEDSDDNYDDDIGDDDDVSEGEVAALAPRKTQQVTEKRNVSQVDESDG